MIVHLRTLMHDGTVCGLTEEDFRMETDDLSAVTCLPCSEAANSACRAWLRAVRRG